ncbi:MAG: glycosyltransferase family 39 protein [Verrucomicrobiota bacterium]|nr:glycosyltransferase family 39 protein [Verrucomicrobiota bacterium]
MGTIPAPFLSPDQQTASGGRRLNARPLRRLTLALWALLLFAACYLLHTRHNHFPYFYHPDEPGKVEQLLSRDWNYNHPMLLLSTTRLTLDMAGVGSSEQAVVEAGRRVSAAFAAGAVVLLALLAWQWRGWRASIVAGGALALHHQVYELSHYLKEDTALLFGLAAVFLFVFLFEQRPTLLRAAGLGAACALAISGKYIGIIALLAALPVLWCAGNTRRAKGFAVFSLSLLAALAVVNLPLLWDLDEFRRSLADETGLVVKGQGGMTRRVPHTQYWNVFIDNTTPVMWLLLPVFWVARWRERRSLTLAEWIVIAFPFVYAVALSFSPKSNDRYFLPATAIFTLQAALGAIDAGRWLVPRLGARIAPAAAAVALILGQVPSWLRYESAFQHDDTQELIAWLKRDVPVSAVIAKDNRVRLPDPQKKKDAARLGAVPQQVLASKFAADLGSLEELRAKGITHVAVSESDYGRFFLKNLRPQNAGDPDFARRKLFYERLLREGDLVFKRDRGTVIYLHPGIHVYRIQ